MQEMMVREHDLMERTGIDKIRNRSWLRWPLFPRRSSWSRFLLLHREPSSRALCGGLIAVSLFSIGTSLARGAESWPQKPVRIVAPFAPGGATDVFARLLAQRLQVSLKQGVVVDNRGGAGGLLGTDLVAKADPDGYTLLFTTNSTTTIGPNLYKNVPYDPLKDLTPINKIVTVVGLLVVHPRIKANSVAELIALARAQNVPLTFASSGTGAIGHLAGELFKAKTGLDMTHVPYKGGAPSLDFHGEEFP
jgi:tripartite-type tricarboxylate transporter receptor subunit TctC